MKNRLISEKGKFSKSYNFPFLTSVLIFVACWSFLGSFLEIASVNIIISTKKQIVAINTLSTLKKNSIYDQTLELFKNIYLILHMVTNNQLVGVAISFWKAFIKFVTLF